MSASVSANNLNSLTPPLFALPDAVLLKILPFLSPGNIYSFLQVSQFTHRLSSLKNREVRIIVLNDMLHSPVADTIRKSSKAQYWIKAQFTQDEIYERLFSLPPRPPGEPNLDQLAQAIINSTVYYLKGAIPASLEAFFLNILRTWHASPYNLPFLISQAEAKELQAFIHGNDGLLPDLTPDSIETIIRTVFFLENDKMKVRTWGTIKEAAAEKLNKEGEALRVTREIRHLKYDGNAAGTNPHPYIYNLLRRLYSYYPVTLTAHPRTFNRLYVEIIEGENIGTNKKFCVKNYLFQDNNRNFILKQTLIDIYKVYERSVWVPRLTVEDNRRRQMVWKEVFCHSLRDVDGHGALMNEAEAMNLRNAIIQLREEGGVIDRLYFADFQWTPGARRILAEAFPRQNQQLEMRGQNAILIGGLNLRKISPLLSQKLSQFIQKWISQPISNGIERASRMGGRIGRLTAAIADLAKRINQVIIQVPFFTLFKPIYFTFAFNLWFLGGVYSYLGLLKILKIGELVLAPSHWSFLPYLAAYAYCSFKSIRHWNEEGVWIHNSQQPALPAH